MFFTASPDCTCFPWRENAKPCFYAILKDVTARFSGYSTIFFNPAAGHATKTAGYLILEQKRWQCIILHIKIPNAKCYRFLTFVHYKNSRDVSFCFDTQCKMLHFLYM